MANLKQCTKLLQRPTVSPYDTFTTGCTHTLKCCFGTKQLKIWHDTCDQNCEVEEKLFCKFAGPTHTIADRHRFTSARITRAVVS